MPESRILYLQNILRDISFEDLPEKWHEHEFDFVQFSKDKTLFDFQQNALRNAAKALHLYFKEKNQDKIAFFEHYKLNGLDENFDYDLKKKENKKTAKYLLEYDKDYPVVNSRIPFIYFINRMSFRMATGSGKTLVIVKLIELLSKLIAKEELPACDILFLTHRDDLLDQFKSHVEEFNDYNFDTKINLRSLRDYESVKRDNILPFTKKEITVFYYRSDLISDKHKEKIVNFKNYDNYGKWYILLDEAHKGDKEESKRQILYSILSRNGFLFNFSATFTDSRDLATCAFDFNLARFIEEGYGKHIYVFQSNIDAFRDKDDFSPIEKQKIVLKSLLLLTCIHKYFEKIRGVNDSLYHRPLLLTLVNSVNIEGSDLELFFRELEKVAKNEIRMDLLDAIKEELKKELDGSLNFEFENLPCKIDDNFISKLEYNDILSCVFNAKTPGKIEVIKIPDNKQELIFKLKTADIPFALIKIGNISDWLKDKLDGYEIIESFENESYFKAINQDDSNINILMGSRSFYEGWDSNRPNIILFINIGVVSDTKKFVQQSIGRGVRIEPLKHKRKRLENLFNAKVIDAQLLQRVEDFILPIESLFVFGTNAQNLKDIINSLKEERQDKSLGEVFTVNPDVQNRILLIPVYKTTEKIFAEESNPQKYLISQEDFGMTSKYYRCLGDKIALVKYDYEPKVLKRVRESFNKKDDYYNFGTENSLYNPELILGKIFKHFSIKRKEFDKFKKLEDEIVHFKKIRFRNGDSYQKLLEEMQKVKKYPEKEKDLKQLKSEFKKHGDLDRYTIEVQKIENSHVKESVFEHKNQRIKIKHLSNHYYFPIIVSESERVDYLSHIITVESEKRFLEKLDEYISQPGNVFAQFDWWMFSKLDQTIDEVYIPYYNPDKNNISNFKPDFIFWAQKANRYLILFIDPKGTEHADGYRKIDGYIRIFEEGDRGQKQSKNFMHDGLVINVKLLLRSDQGLASVLEEYKQYWFDSFNSLVEKLSFVK